MASPSSMQDAILLQNLLMTSTIQQVGLSTNIDQAAAAALNIISIDDLINDQSIILQKEQEDRNRLNAFFTPTMDSLRASLLAWASNGFPGIAIISTVRLEPPDVCSDGQRRTLPYYIEYLLNDTIGNKLESVNQMTVGMSFTYSWAGTTVNLHVTRA